MKYSRIILTLALVSAVACSDNDGGDNGPPATLCKPGTHTCFANVAATCADDGKSYTSIKCSETQMCQANTGTCKTVECMPGQTRCFDGTTTQKALSKCVGGAWTKVNCAADEVCAGAQCRKKTCEAGSAQCLWGFIATCNEQGDGWAETACPDGQVCGKEQCIDKACSPNQNRCLNADTKQTCDEFGSAWGPESSCPSGQECVENLGVCLPKLASETAPAPDVIQSEPDTVTDTPDDGPPAEEDTGPKTELEPLDLAQCTVEGDKIEFTSNLSATYLEDEQDLRISMDKGQKKIEISIKPIESGDIGEWSSEVAEDVQVFIFYNDGSDIGGAQWKYQSVEYSLTLDKFQSPGGRVIGTFSGKFTPDQGKTVIPFGESKPCSFDVKRHD